MSINYCNNLNGSDLTTNQIERRRYQIDCARKAIENVPAYRNWQSICGATRPQTPDPEENMSGHSFAKQVRYWKMEWCELEHIRTYTPVKRIEESPDKNEWHRLSAATDQSQTPYSEKDVIERLREKLTPSVDASGLSKGWADWSDSETESSTLQ